MQNITILPEITQHCPNIAFGLLRALVTVEEGREDLWGDLELRLEQVRERTTIENIRDVPPVAATRKAYKACGKDPSRYRPSAEALLRRLANGKGLYRINTVVDALNWLSAETGYSIGGFDADQVKGEVTFGVGRKNEPYQAIGRGELNIADMPVLRDEIGAFGTPTSDCERTMVRPETKAFWMVFYGFDGKGRLEEALHLADALLQLHGSAWAINTKIIHSS